MFVKFRPWLIQRPPLVKRFIVVTIDAVLLALILAATATITHDWQGLPAPALQWLLPLTVLAAIPILASQGIYKAIIRFIGEEMVFGLLRGITLLALVAGLVDFALFGVPRQSVATAFVFWAFSLLALTGSRLLMRAMVAGRSRRGERVAIYGAGKAGMRLAAAVATGRDWRPVLFVDDNPALHGRLVAGLPVCAPEALPTLVSGLNIRRVLLALPSVSRHKRQEVIVGLEALSVRVQTVPDIGDLVSGRARVEDVRDVDVVDLLGRETVPPNEKLLHGCIDGKSVMVTGAGGSIGSELCRQIVRLRPQRLVLFEISEPALFAVDQELRRIRREFGLELEIVPVLGSVHHRPRVHQVMTSFAVQTVYHAAAYKHVPLVEYNMLEGVHNNILGTWYAAEAACDAGVETFVLVSTDKAVSPVNVMGATKRFAELVLQALSQRQSDTRFCMVRFGNVLDSSGSVVPIFREQIRRGGPVTVTHRDIFRYFMTIPEAAQLVLQAGSMSTGGDVFVLDMGKPVRIADLARHMIHLMGLTVRDEENPDGDIAIRYTGLRPAEKLYEELLIGNNVTGTDHPMIMRAMEESLSWEALHQYLEKILQACAWADCDRARDLLREVVGGYRPTNGVDDVVWKVAGGVRATSELPAMPATVTDIAARRAGPAGG